MRWKPSACDISKQYLLSASINEFIEKYGNNGFYAAEPIVTDWSFCCLFSFISFIPIPTPTTLLLFIRWQSKHDKCTYAWQTRAHNSVCTISSVEIEIRSQNYITYKISQPHLALSRFFVPSILAWEFKHPCFLFRIHITSLSWKSQNYYILFVALFTQFVAERIGWPITQLDISVEMGASLYSYYKHLRNVSDIAQFVEKSNYYKQKKYERQVNEPYSRRCIVGGYFFGHFPLCRAFKWNANGKI